MDAQDDPDVMLQRIVHDGLVGDGFLRQFVVTWDLPGSRIVLVAAAVAQEGCGVGDNTQVRIRSGAGDGRSSA